MQVGSQDLLGLAAHRADDAASGGLFAAARVGFGHVE